MEVVKEKEKEKEEVVGSRKWTSGKYPIPVHPSWDVLDVTKLTTAISCLRKYFFEYVLGWRPEAANLDLVFGGAVHLGLEVLKREGYSLAEVKKGYEVFLKEFRRWFSPEWDERCSPKSPLRARELFEGWAAKWEEEDEKWEVLGIEESGRVPVGGGRELAFRLDTRRRNRETGRFGCLEHKTGKRFSEAWSGKWDLALQASCYHHVLAQRHGLGNLEGITIDGLFTRPVKDNSKAERVQFERILTYRGKEELKMFLRVVNYWWDRLEVEFERLRGTEKVLEAFPPTGLGERCWDYNRPCPYRELCRGFGEPMGYVGGGPPLGFKVEFWNPLNEGKEEERSD